MQKDVECGLVHNCILSLYHCYLLLVYNETKQLIFLYLSVLALHLFSSLYAQWLTWINVSLHEVSWLLASFQHCAQCPDALLALGHTLYSPSAMIDPPKYTI